MGTTLTVDEVIASAPGAKLALEKRSIQMRQFKSKEPLQRCVKDQIVVPLGQIAGVIYDVIEKPGTLPNGESKTSLLALGDFQAIVYATGEVIEAKSAYLPGYFAEALRSLFIKGVARAAEIGIEICVEPTGLDEQTGLPKGIPFSYGVKNLMARRAADPLEAVKRRMAAGGMLKLPAPPRLEEQRALPLDARGALGAPGEYMDSTGDLVDITHDDHGGTPHDDNAADKQLAAANAIAERGPAGRKAGAKQAASEA